MESLLKDEGRWLITASDRLPPRHFSAGPLQRTTSQTTRRRILQCPSFNVEPIPIKGSGKEAARSSLSCANTHTRTHARTHTRHFLLPRRSQRRLAATILPSTAETRENNNTISVGVTFLFRFFRFT